MRRKQESTLDKLGRLSGHGGDVIKGWLHFCQGDVELVWDAFAFASVGGDAFMIMQREMETRGVRYFDAP